jgi:hypothetical protein
MDNIGTYEECKFPAFRNPTIDTLDLGFKKHHIPALLEVDVTEAREYLRELKARTGEGLSFTLVSILWLLLWAALPGSQALSARKSKSVNICV